MKGGKCMKNKVKMCMCVYLYKFYKDFLFLSCLLTTPRDPFINNINPYDPPNPQNFPLFFIHFASSLSYIPNLYKLCIFSPIFINLQFLTFRLLQKPLPFSAINFARVITFTLSAKTLYKMHIQKPATEFQN